MRFRAKIFLAILLPAIFLVASAVGVVLAGIGSRAAEAAKDDFDRTRNAVRVILQETAANLGRLDETFQGPYFQEFVNTGARPEQREALRKNLPSELESLGVRLDYFAAVGPDGKAWIRLCEAHPCDGRCRHEDEVSWSVRKKTALFRSGADPFMGWRVFEVQKGGALVLGRALGKDLLRITGNLGIHLALHQDGVEIYRSLEAWSPDRDREGDVVIGGVHYLAGRSPLEGMGDMTLLLMRSMEKVDRDRRFVLTLGGSGLAVAFLLAALVSLRVSRGVSRPVEALTGAVQKVATGDFGVQVEVAGADEIGRLGQAFNEMTVGLRKRQDILEKTLSRDVAEEFLKGGTERGGERRVITIVFMDIRGYTSGTEGMDPADVVIMLNELMDLLDGAIERHGGLVNKFLGDGLMAMFGTPKPLENHALHAVEAAIEMQKQMERWNHRRIARGLNSFYSGIGINTGQAVCGKVGGRNRMEYTLIGEEVNLTSRICGKAAPRQVLITKQTYELVKDKIQVNPMEPVVVKGLSYPIKIYEVVS